MTISDKIRIYELSRDLNLDNKDILDAAQKLSISVKSHSSSITAEDAQKIKNLIIKKNSDKKILSINKPLIKKETYKQNKDNKLPVISSKEGKSISNNSTKKPLLVKPLNKPESPKTILNQTTNPNKPNIVISSQSKENQRNRNLRDKPKHNLNQDKKTLQNKITSPAKSPAKPPIQLIAKPKNITNKPKYNDPIKINFNTGDRRQQLNRANQNTDKPKTKNSSNRITPPELVGAPIRRDDSKTYPNRRNTNDRRNSSSNQTTFNRNTSPARPGMQNRSGLKNKPTNQSRTGSFSRQFNSNRAGSPNDPNNPNRPHRNFRQGGVNSNGSKFNSQRSSGIRKPVSPNELLQLQKTNNSDKDKLGTKNTEKQNIESPKQKVKAPNIRPNAAPSSKKQPNRSFSNNSKKLGKADWDDSAKLEALRNKNPHKQRQKVHIIGENDETLTSETSGYSGEKISILSASLARPKKEKSDEAKSQKSIKQLKKKKKETTRQRQKRRAMELKAAKEAKQLRP